MHHGARVNAVAFSPDGCWLATADNYGTARIWDAANGQELLSVDQIPWGACRGVAFSPDGRKFATASDPSAARIWDANSGRQLAEVTHGNLVWGVAFSPDGRRLATASKDNTARIWALVEGSDDEQS